MNLHYISLAISPALTLQVKLVSTPEHDECLALSSADNKILFSPVLWEDTPYIATIQTITPPTGDDYQVIALREHRTHELVGYLRSFKLTSEAAAKVKYL